MSKSIDVQAPWHHDTPGLPWRLGLARGACRLLPPLLGQRVRSWLYPMARAYADDLAYTTRAVTGSRFAGRTGDFHAYPFSAQGYYEWRNLAVALAVCQQGDTILEIGANIGTETVGFRDIVGESGRVIAVEPFPEHCRALQHLVQLNDWRNVEIRQMALGDTSGEITFVRPPDQHASGVGHIRGQNESIAGNGIRVSCARLDEVAHRFGEIDAIFMDTEGAEYSILHGGKMFIASTLPYLVLEASPRLLCRAGSSVDQLRTFLLNLGYAVLSISRFGLKAFAVPVQSRACNWFCTPRSTLRVAERVTGMIQKCGLLPPFMSPLGRVRSRIEIAK